MSRKEFLTGKTYKGNTFESHGHTTESDGAMRPEDAVDLAMEIGITALAVTDHHTIRGAEIAEHYAQAHQYPIEIVPGCEITTAEKWHVVALFYKGDIPRGKTLQEVVEIVRLRKGVVYMAHPIRENGSVRTVDKNVVLGISQEGIGWEVYNATLDMVAPEANVKSAQVYQQHRHSLGAQFAGWDAHFYRMGGLTGYRGDLYTAIRDRQTIALCLDREEEEIGIRVSGRKFPGGLKVERDYYEARGLSKTRGGVIFDGIK